MGCENAELSILIVDDIQMAEYHRDYLNREGPTNVIAFAMQEGDVVISLDTANREAAEMGIHVMERFDELLIHGILHLVGYDHERSEAEERRMAEKSAVLASLLRKAGNE